MLINWPFLSSLLLFETLQVPQWCDLNWLRCCSSQSSPQKQSTSWLVLFKLIKHPIFVHQYKNSSRFPVHHWLEYWKLHGPSQKIPTVAPLPPGAGTLRGQGANHKAVLRSAPKGNLEKSLKQKAHNPPSFVWSLNLKGQGSEAEFGNGIWTCNANEEMDLQSQAPFWSPPKSRHKSPRPAERRVHAL